MIDLTLSPAAIVKFRADGFIMLERISAREQHASCVNANER